MTVVSTSSPKKSFRSSATWRAKLVRSSYIVSRMPSNFKGREKVDFAGKSAELNHLAANGTSPQGQAISLDFWVDDNRKLIKIAVPSQGVEAYQEGFEPGVESKSASVTSFQRGAAKRD